MKEGLGFRAKGRKIIRADDAFKLREVIRPYDKATDQDSGCLRSIGVKIIEY
jgi:hypothetical protein